MSQTSVADRPESQNQPTYIEGMGPIILENAVAFRVWAPNADAVSVIGNFNDWNAKANPLNREDSGCWMGVVEGAKPGDQYKYEITAGENTFQRIDPRVREVTNSVGNGVIHQPDFDWQGDDFQMPAWNELVIYESHVGTFFRDGKEGVGTFEDYIKKFDHLKKLGVNALQIMPIAEFAGDYSWGYNPAHPFAIEEAYGGPLGFKTFVREAHRAGFAVILDVVYNHFGPSDLDLWQFDGWSENGKGGIYFYNDYRSSTPWGDTRPDYGRGEVRSYIRDNAMMWIEDFHVDGLRYDMTLYIRSVDASGQQEIPEGWGLTQWINREIHSFKPSAITIAEDLQNNDYLTKSDIEGGAAFSAQWDANFVHPIRDVITQPDDAARDMEKVRHALYHSYNCDPFQRVIYTESHDEVANGKSRIPSEVDNEDPGNWFAQKRAGLGLALVMTAPGIPMLFQGQSILQDGWFTDTEELDWENAKEYEGISKLTADLIALRLNRDGISKGLTGKHVDVFHVNNDKKVVAFRRHFDGGPGDDVIVVINFANQHFEQYEFGLPSGGVWIRRFSSDRSEYSEEFGDDASGNIQAIVEPYDGQSHRGRIELPPYTVLIYSQNPS
ncbi:alpha-amylase family glycosyl hydrolase [Aporhodopirellula aestuarii]|uniref:1,4-alpha-glucan branching enzyme n=1 Tax=Aporhodopirellula aestuarii TaxID=2950107 RepID=A0ABT0TZ75_9BACT|nr:alpha-amylase family glycosyl hydrolase [Aporhodopirellula aestuarii]MCM2369684.1 alpha-amylase family glycosyl hydrolase [Aporhodopirellula aestuarii]